MWNPLRQIFDSRQKTTSSMPYHLIGPKTDFSNQNIEEWQQVFESRY